MILPREFAGLVASALLLAVLIVPCRPARGDQPIFNEMPRWDNGWGFQFIEEYRSEDDLLFGDTVIGPGFTEEVHVLHFEGVYTWDKAIRLTFKLPYVLDASRELLADDGSRKTQSDEGIGDLTLALPLKDYFNLDQRSGSWTIAPQLRVPLSGDDEYEVYDGEWGTGLSFGYDTETYRWILAIGAGGWFYYGDEPFEAVANIDIGRNLQAFGSSGHVRWETDLHFEDDDSLTLSTGPSLYWMFTDTVHTKVSWKHDVYDRQGVVDHGNGDSVKVGLGFVF